MGKKAPKLARESATPVPRDAPFRATRSKKNLFASADNGRIVALGAPVSFDTARLLETAEERAEEAFWNGVDDDVGSPGSPVRGSGEPVAAIVRRSPPSSRHASPSEFLKSNPVAHTNPGKRVRRELSPSTAPAKRARRGCSPNRPGHGGGAVAHDERPGPDFPAGADSSAPLGGGGLRRRESSKERSKRHFKERRRVQRAQKAQELPRAGLDASKEVALSRLKDAVPIQTPLILGIKHAGGGRSPDNPPPTFCPVAPSGFVGTRPKPSQADDTVMTVDDARALGFRYVEWDGRTPHVILDGQGRVIGVLAGAPRGADWLTVTQDACAALDRARCTLGEERENTTHRRGQFSVIASGISYGGGQKEPCNRSLLRGEQEVVDELLADRAIRRIAGFGNGAFRLFAPNLHRSYAENLDALLTWKPSLKPNFRRSVFGSVTFNMGPRTQTLKHTDFQNRAAGMCAVTALGSFDHKRGGHLILWELEMVVEFPSGSTVLIPSALLAHSNTAVQPHERRCSVTQYSAGGLFRFVECGFQTEKGLFASGGKYERTGEERWHGGLELFSR